MLQFKMINQKNKKEENKFLIEKKAQIGTTLTWFVAFIIIFFIITLFIVGTILVSGKKNAPLVGSGKDEISLGIYTSNLKSQRSLTVLYNSQYNIENKKLDFNEMIVFSVNKYGDKSDVISSGGYNVKEGYDELKQGINGLFEDSDIVWNINVYDKEIYDNPTGGVISTRDFGAYYVFERKDWKCDSGKSKFEKTIDNLNNIPEKIFVIYEICTGHELSQTEKADAGLVGGGP